MRAFGYGSSVSCKAVKTGKRKLLMEFRLWWGSAAFSRCSRIPSVLSPHFPSADGPLSLSSQTPVLLTGSGSVRRFKHEACRAVRQNFDRSDPDGREPATDSPGGRNSI